MKAMMVGLIAAVIGTLTSVPGVFAASNVVISQVQPGDTLSASNEAVELYNNALIEQDITNWCIRYSSGSSSALASSPKYCFIPSDLQTKIFLGPQAFASIVTNGYTVAGGLAPDGRFSGSGIAAAGGHVKIVAALGETIDTVGWGTAIFAEGYVAITNPAPPAPSASQVLMRKIVSAGVLADTDNNKHDFELKSVQLRTGGIYEVRTPVDLCGNLIDIQENLPVDYGYDEAGNCERLSHDRCKNIAAVQLVVPEDLVADEAGNCVNDACPNLDGLQVAIPTGFSMKNNSCLELEKRALLLNELLPNVSGSDTGKEFIELYNPNDEAISTEGYVLQLGKNYESSISIGSVPFVVSIPAHGYLVYHDDELGFSLLNTTNRLRIVAPAGNVVSDTAYSEPDEDQSWAYIDGAWDYTNQLTPAAANREMLSEVLGVTNTAAVSLSTCPAGKYRHPITNRCRSIETDASILITCDADEYRNPDTNRCRKISTLAASLTPCNIGFERNPSTNRCRKTSSSSTSSSLKPCQVGYERNVETNRCKKTMSSPSPLQNTATVVADTSGDIVQNVLFGTAAIGALSYGLFEWRSELGAGIRHLLRMLLQR